MPFASPVVKGPITLGALRDVLHSIDARCIELNGWLSVS